LTGDPEIPLLSLAEARRAIGARRLSSVELTQATLALAESLNPKLNAYLHIAADSALAQAADADRRDDNPPLLGIPVCVKDVIDVAGMPTTAGSKRWSRKPSRDAAAVALLKEAGAVVIGKGHSNEFAYGIDGLNPHWGNCNNPHDPLRISGGSSSGPAVATAAGLALAGLGTDTSGSIRVPASLCGLVGVRPTPGRISNHGVVALAWSYDVVGPLARTVEDASIMLDALIPSEKRGQHDLRGARIGVLDELVDAGEPYIAAGVGRVIARLEALGAQLTTVGFPMLEHVNAIHYTIQQAEASQAHTPWFDAQRTSYSEPVRLRLEVGRLLPASAYLTAQQARRLLIDRFAATAEGLDAMIAPATPLVAPLQTSTEVTVNGQTQSLRSGLLSLVTPFSQLACPVVSAPIGWHEGLPFGVQIIGRPYGERQALDIAGACCCPFDAERGS
jgi:aspartyl-tRNA(Asn)/glutamyl-tRNA(Gln) amidotransferase subunit A